MLQNFEEEVINSLLYKMGSSSNVTFIKYYNKVHLSKDTLDDILKDEKIKLLYHSYNSIDMHSAYEPFFEWIKQLYEEYFKDEYTPEEFILKCNVYPLQRCLFISYMKTGTCERNEEMLISEKEYEEERMIKSIIDIFKYVSNKTPLFIVLDRVHLSCLSTLELLHEFVIATNTENIIILADYDDSYDTNTYLFDSWIKLIKMLEYKNKIFDMDMIDYDDNNVEIEGFKYEESDIDEYIHKIFNMIRLVAVEQAVYYLDIVYDKINYDKVHSSKEIQMTIIYQYALADLYVGNNTHGLLMCEMYNNLNNEQDEYKKFTYYYIACLIKNSAAKDFYAEEYISNCEEIAKKLDEEILYIRTTVLTCITINNNFRNSKYGRALGLDNKKIEKQLKDNNFNNLLINVYAYIFENDELLFEKIDNGDENFYYFYKAIEMAKKMDNYKFIFDLYDSRMFSISFRNYNKIYIKLQNELMNILKESGIEIGNDIYMGMAYTYTRTENYVEAHRYCNQVLAKVYEEAYAARMENSMINKNERIMGKAEINKIYQSNLVAEILYNISTNYVSAGEYELALSNLKVMANILENSVTPIIKVCNISKIYMMISLCYYYTNMNHNAYLYLNKAERFFAHIVFGNGETAWWDDSLFLYYFVKGLLAKKRGEYEKALAELEHSTTHLKWLEGQFFWLMPMFLAEKMNIYYCMNDLENAETIAKEGIDFCNEKALKEKTAIFMAKLCGIHYKKPVRKFEKTEISLQQILDMSRNEKMELQLSEKSSNNQFLSSWQDILNADYESEIDLMNKAMETLRYLFEMDYIIYISANNDDYEVKYSNIDISKDVNIIVDFFKTHKEAFWTNRVEPRFKKYNQISEIFDTYSVVSLVGVPIFRSSFLEGVLLTVVKMKNNFNVNQNLVGDMQFETIKTAFTQYIDADKRLRTQKELADANMAKSIFLANMSHEIRTPMNAIIGMAEIILRDELSPNVRKSTLDILGAGRTLLSIINDILDFSKIESGKMEITKVKYKMSSVIYEITNMANFRINDKDLELRVNVDPKLPNELYGDEIRLRQILLNLIGNAVKYTDHGFVEVRVRWRQDGENALIRVEIEDSGRGIKKSDQAKLFECFQRVDLKKNGRIEGTGLGLSICKRLLENMNGTIGVKSEYGVGSTFYFELPQKIVDNAELYGDVANVDIIERNSLNNNTGSFKVKGIKVLVVDDNELNIKVAEGMLKIYDIIIDKANSGKECLEMAKNNNYDIIFLDHMMPEMDGLETIECLKKMDGFNSIVVALTANAIAGVKDMYLQHGFNEYLTKPIDLKKLEEVLVKFFKDNIEYLDEEEQKKQEAKIYMLTENMNKIMKYFEEKNIKIEILPEFMTGDTKQYDNIITYFAKSSDERIETLNSALQKMDLVNYSISVHALKSNAKYLGHSELANLAYELEIKSKEGNLEFVKQNHGKLIELLEVYVLAINDYTVDNNLINETVIESNGMVISEDELKTKLEEVKVLLDDFETEEAGEKVKEIIKFELEDDVKKLIIQALEYIDDCNYKAGAKIISSLLN